MSVCHGKVAGCTPKPGKEQKQTVTRYKPKHGGEFHNNVRGEGRVRRRWPSNCTDTGGQVEGTDLLDPTLPEGSRLQSPRKKLRLNPDFARLVHAIARKGNAVCLRDVDIQRPITRNIRGNSESKFPRTLIPRGFRNRVLDIDQSSTAHRDAAGRKLRQLARNCGKARERNRHHISRVDDDVDSEHE